jgi:hypothetical protein
VLKGETVRKALIPAFLLLLGAAVLGSTVFREQIARAAATPFQNVVVTNTATNPAQVHQVGTSTTSVSGTVGIDPSQNTVQVASPGPVKQQCFSFGSRFDVPFGNVKTPLCQSDFYVTDITASGMDDNMVVEFQYNGNEVLQLRGSDADGAASYQLDLTHPIHVDEIDAFCDNTSTDCFFSLVVLGNSTGT